MLIPSVFAIYSKALTHKPSVKLQLTYKPSEEMGLMCQLQKKNREGPTLPLGVTGNTPLVEL